MHKIRESNVEKWLRIIASDNESIDSEIIKDIKQGKSVDEVLMKVKKESKNESGDAF